MNENRQGSEQDTVEITPQMVDAGLLALIEYRGEGDVLLVTEIARAILRQLRAEVAPQ